MHCEIQACYFPLRSILDSRNCEIKKNIREGLPRNSDCNVCKGDKVTILASFKGMTIKTQGEALEDGRVGDNIAIRNIKSGKMIQAQVTNALQVEVNI